MKEDFDRTQIKTAIDHQLSGLRGDPWLARRIINAEEGEPVKMKKKISASFVVVVLTLILTLSAAFALVSSKIGSALFGNEQDIPGDVLSGISAPGKGAATENAVLTLDEWLYDGTALHTAFTVENPTGEPLLYTVDGIWLENGQGKKLPLTASALPAEGAGSAGLLLGGSVGGKELPQSYQLYNKSEMVFEKSSSSPKGYFTDVPEGDFDLKIRLAVWKPLNAPQWVDYQKYEGENISETKKHLVVQDGYADLELFRPAESRQDVFYGESSAEIYAETFRELGWAELLGFVELEEKVTLNKNSLEHLSLAEGIYSVGGMEMWIDRFAVTRAGGEVAGVLYGNPEDALKLFEGQGLFLVDRGNGKILSTGTFWAEDNGEKEGVSFQLTVAPFTEAKVGDLWLAPAVECDPRWDSALPDYDAALEKPEDVVEMYQFDFSRGVQLKLEAGEE